MLRMSDRYYQVGDLDEVTKQRLTFRMSRPGLIPDEVRAAR